MKIPREILTSTQKSGMLGFDVNSEWVSLRLQCLNFNSCTPKHAKKKRRVATDLPLPPFVKPTLDTVDGKNTAPVDRQFIICHISHSLRGSYTSQVVQDFFRQQ